MNWSHILIEGFCLFDTDSDSVVPSCCINGLGNTGINCLLSKETEKSMCPYFGFQEAKSTILLTNNIGVSIEFDSFDSDELDENEWRKKELDWIENKKELINIK